jgi:hypothetical protein
MSLLTLQAHYDGKQVVLDEPCNLPANTPLIVAPVHPAGEGDSEAAWLKAAASSDAFAFLRHPAEDVYTITDGEPFEDAV